MTWCHSVALIVAVCSRYGLHINIVGLLYVKHLETRLSHSSYLIWPHFIWTESTVSDQVQVRRGCDQLEALSYLIGRSHSERGRFITHTVKMKWGQMWSVIWTLLYYSFVTYILSRFHTGKFLSKVTCETLKSCVHLVRGLVTNSFFESDFHKIEHVIFVQWFAKLIYEKKFLAKVDC